MPALLNNTGDPARARHPYFNCRVYERQSCELPVACQPAAAFGKDETSWSGTVRDVSQGGLRLTLERRFEPGSGLAVEVPEDANGDGQTILVKVVHVKRQLDGWWSLGCKFISELSEDEIRRLVSAGNQAPALEPQQRLKAVLTGPLALTKVRLQVLVNSAALIDCVAEHLLVPASWPLRVGATMTLRGGKATGSPWKIQLRVVTCSQNSEGWVLRGELLNVPSPAALLHFVSQNE
jgi:hypothetical protein